MRTALIAFAIVLVSFAACAGEVKGDGLFAKVNTSKGLVIINLAFEKAPLTVRNFVGLAEGKINHSRGAGKPFYDGLTFHRVIPGNIAQGGCPEGTGRGSPGYSFNDEFHKDLRHSGPGILSMANSGPNTNGSQFFITSIPRPGLDDRHSVFGNVVSGMDVIKKLANGDRIISVKILRRGKKAEAFHVDNSAFHHRLAEMMLDNNIDSIHKIIKEKVLEKRAATLQKLKAKLKNTKTTQSLITYAVLAVPEKPNPKPKQGEVVAMHYTGYLPKGLKFDSSVDRGRPYQFKAGVGAVIPGWDEMVMDMQVGEKRILMIPPHLAYGPNGYPPVIPGNATLIFEVERVAVNSPVAMPKPKNDHSHKHDHSKCK